MPANEYEFLTEWHVSAPRELIYEILSDAREYPRWWPDVYLKADYEPSGRVDGIGDQVTLLTKGWLPYRLRWTAETVCRDKPRTIEIKATGDFVGHGIWLLESDGDHTRITFDWRLRADKPLIRWFSPVLKPIFKWNHGWAMARGYERLCREIERRTRDKKLKAI